tara:strand:+ start:341 stop:469 length:129 start_codon:yes stop_codon:yes gene_type:complete
LELFIAVMRGVLLPCALNQALLKPEAGIVAMRNRAQGPGTGD